MPYPQAKFPHCDSDVLHSPKSGCKYCDMFPAAQQERIDKNINFTGEGNPNKLPCPAELKRPLKIINHWGGNIPSSDLCSTCAGTRWVISNNNIIDCPTCIKPEFVELKCECGAATAKSPFHSAWCPLA